MNERALHKAENEKVVFLSTRQQRYTVQHVHDSPSQLLCLIVFTFLLLLSVVSLCDTHLTPRK